MNIERITELARKQGKTLTHLCKLLGKRRSYLGDVRRDDLNLPQESLELLAKDLGTTPEYLLFKTDDPTIPNNDDVDCENMIVFHRNGHKVVEHLTSKQMQMLTKMLDVIKDDGDDL